MRWFEWLRTDRPEVQRSFDSIVADLGGPEAVSASQAMLAHLAATTEVMVRRIDNYISGRPDLVDESHRQKPPLVRDRQRIAESLCRLFNQLRLTVRADEASTYCRPPGDREPR
jgi:hypothetical protein